jgi:hypothetical protein
MIHDDDSLFPAEIDTAILEHDVISKMAVSGSTDNKYENKPPVSFAITLTKHYEQPT